MSRRLHLEAFDGPVSVADPVLQAEAEGDDARLAAFEQGYSAGWDDAVAAQGAEAERLRTDLGRNLQELSFTYHEARAHVLKALRPLLGDMVAKVLPAIARQTLGAIVVEALRPMAEDLASAPVRVVLSPQSRALVEPLLRQAAAPPVEIVEEPTLGPGQVYLRLGQSERRIDIDGVIAAIESAVATFFQIGEEVSSDG